MGSYTKLSVMEYMYTCEHMYIRKEVLSASTRKGTDICELAQHGFTYKSIVDMIYIYVCVYMYTCEYMHVYREVLSVSTRKGIDICELAKHGVIYKSICNMKYIYL